MITQDELKDLVTYDPITGHFFWKVQLSPKAKLGVPIGSDNGKGQLRIFIHKKGYLLHRLAFLYMEGAVPKLDVDHRNGIRSDNKWSNLRVCSKLENAHNRGCSRKLNGLFGVKASYQKVGKPFRSSIMLNGKSQHIGYFDTELEGHHAYLIAKKVLHPFWDTDNLDARSVGLDLTYPGHLSKKFQKFIESRMAT